MGTYHESHLALEDVGVEDARSRHDVQLNQRTSDEREGKTRSPLGLESVSRDGRTTEPSAGLERRDAFEVKRWR